MSVLVSQSSCRVREELVALLLLSYICIININVLCAVGRSAVCDCSIS